MSTPLDALSIATEAYNTARDVYQLESAQLEYLHRKQDQLKATWRKGRMPAELKAMGVNLALQRVEVKRAEDALRDATAVRDAAQAAFNAEQVRLVNEAREKKDAEEQAFIDKLNATIWRANLYGAKHFPWSATAPGCRDSIEDVFHHATDPPRVPSTFARRHRHIMQFLEGEGYTEDMLKRHGIDRNRYVRMMFSVMELPYLDQERIGAYLKALKDGGQLPERYREVVPGRTTELLDEILQ